MKAFRKALLAALIAAGFSATAAQASITVQNWQLDLGAVAGEGLAGTVVGVDEITFRGIAQTATFDTDGSSSLSLGDAGVVYGALAATAYTVNGGPAPGPVGASMLNVDYEMTFVFQTDTFTTMVAGSVQTAAHRAEGTPGNVTTGLLHIYIDNISDGSKSSTESGLGFDDGALIATFRVAGGGVVFDSSLGDGSDDAIFELVAADAGVLLDQNGNDLTIGALLAFSDSDFDADQNNDGVFDIPAPTNNAVVGGDLCVGVPCLPLATFYSLEDGSVVIAQVPEPASLLMVASGLLGLGVSGRRSARKH